MHASPLRPLPWLLFGILYCACHRKAYDLTIVEAPNSIHTIPDFGYGDACSAGRVQAYASENEASKKCNILGSSPCGQGLGFHRYCEESTRRGCCCRPDRVIVSKGMFSTSTATDGCTDDPHCPKGYIALLSGHADLCAPGKDTGKETGDDVVGVGAGGRILKAKRLEFAKQPPQPGEQPREIVDIAVKVVRGNAQSALKECKMMTQFQQSGSPSALKMFACDRLVSKPEVFLTFMELAVGKSLGEKVFDFKENKPKDLDQQVLLDYMMQMATAVADVHLLNLAHRDIKLDNFVVAMDREGNDVVKLIDFGLAEYIGAEIGDQGKELHVGTPLTMAPECWNENRPSKEADVWSLGVTYLHMIFAQFPCSYGKDKDFQTDCWKNLEGARAKNGLATYFLKNEGVQTQDYSPELLELLDGMMKINAGERLTMKEVKNKLEHLKQLKK